MICRPVKSALAGAIGWGPKEQSAAAGMIDMLLGLHGMLAKRTRPHGG